MRGMNAAPLSSLSLATIRLVRKPGALEIAAGTTDIAKKGTWRLGAAALAGIIAGAGFVFGTAWWHQALAALFAIAGVVFLGRFLIMLAFAPLVGAMSSVRVTMVGVPRVEFLTFSIPFAQIAEIQLDAASRAIFLRQRDGRATQLPDIFQGESPAVVEAIVTWMQRVHAAQDAQTITQLFASP
jgi:hypothetical protein